MSSEGINYLPCLSKMLQQSVRVCVRQQFQKQQIADTRVCVGVLLVPVFLQASAPRTETLFIQSFDLDRPG